MDDQEWQSRKATIEAYLSETLRIKHVESTDLVLKPLAIYQDRIGWYLYLVEMFLYSPIDYEYAQGSRIVPIFKRLGQELNTLKSVEGLDGRVQKILFSDKQTPDSGIFELTTALLWARNGWDVAFIDEAPPEPRPDFKATKEGVEWQIECKRLSQNSEYAKAEREAWLSMWKPFVDLLIKSELQLVLNITFHVELNELPKDFLTNELARKLTLITGPAIVIDNSQWTVTVEYTDLNRINTHLEEFYVKDQSTQLNELISGRSEPNRGFTSAILGNLIHMGDEGKMNRYVSEISFATCAFWSCDAETATQKKARDVRTKLSQAVKQLPVGVKSAVHIGLETLDGALVEEKRYRRIFDTVQKFDAKGISLERVYVHLFQPYSPPDQSWVYDETVYYFNKSNRNIEQPLSFLSMITPPDDFIDDVHWRLEPP
jgi:hypothetical protein